jgi:hypothetical protein
VKTKGFPEELILLKITRNHILFLIFLVSIFGLSLKGQELEPRAYASAPVGLNAFAAGYAYSSGSVLFDPTLPFRDVTANINTVNVGYFQSINFFGRYSNVTATLPYLWGPIEGLVNEDFTRITRSGLASPRFRLAVNLFGAPALKLGDFVQYRQKTNIGFSFTMTTPLGQYDPNKLINLGTNRWAFKPEIGISHARNRWIFEFAFGAWFFSANDQFFGNVKREQDPVISTQGHIIYNLPKKMWVGFNANFFRGGRTQNDGIESTAPPLRNSRFGLTFSFPIYRRHSIRILYNDGMFTRLGTDFSQIAFIYQFVWLGL